MDRSRFEEPTPAVSPAFEEGMAALYIDPASSVEALTPPVSPTLEKGMAALLIDPAYESDESNYTDSAMDVQELFPISTKNTQDNPEEANQKASAPQTLLAMDHMRHSLEKDPFFHLHPVQNQPSGITPVLDGPVRITPVLDQLEDDEQLLGFYSAVHMTPSEAQAAWDHWCTFDHDDHKCYFDRDCPSGFFK